MATSQVAKGRSIRISKGPSHLVQEFLMLDYWNPKKRIYWLMECDTIAGSASFVVSGYPDVQVTSLRNVLRGASAEGFNWREVYESVYKSWHSRRPHFPDPDAMALLMEP